MRSKRKTVPIHSQRRSNRIKALPKHIVTKQHKKKINTENCKEKNKEETELDNEQQITDFEFQDVPTLLSELGTDPTKVSTEISKKITKLTLNSYLNSCNNVNNNVKINYYNDLAQTVFAQTNIKPEGSIATYTLLSTDYVVNSTLFNRFKSAKSALKQQGKSTEEIWAYHGTHSNNLDSIVKNGFYLPSRKGYSRSNGTAWGNGLYIGATIRQSTSYANALDADNPIKNRMKLILCRVLVGKVDRYFSNWTISDKDARNDCDSYFCQDRFYVSFKSAHVLPVFILELQVTYQ